ncbi:MAG: LacI family DNA-binding transcriptional regulator [Edaphobacter sp.]
MAIRLKDIAQDLNVSVITVSKALRGGTDISEATRQRVLKRVKELDYQPNMTARSLATGQSRIVGLIVPELLNPFFNELAKSVGSVLRENAYGLIIACSEESSEIERSEIRMMLARGVDALLLASCQPSLKRLRNLPELTIPLVLIDRPFHHLGANFVGTDDCRGGQLATEHLIQLGRTRIAYIGSPDLGPEADRYRGFRTALKTHNIKVHRDLVVPSTAADKAADQAGYDIMSSLLKRGRQKPDAVFCHNDVIALGAMRATLDAGLEIPKNIAFVGFDNVRHSKYLQIPLTSIDQCTLKLGSAAANLTLDLVTGKVKGPRNVTLAPTLVVRESSVGRVAR